jgi:hypothetical protein
MLHLDNVWPSKKSRRIFMFPNLVRSTMVQDVSYDQRGWVVLKCSSRLLTQFSQWKPIDTFTCENWTDNRSQVLNEWEPIMRINSSLYTYTFLEWEPIARTNSNLYIYIFLENWPGFFIELRYGSQSLWLLLLFLSCWGTALLLVLFLFSHYYSSFIIIIIINFLFIFITLLSLLLFFSCCYSSSHMVLFFPCDELI